MFPGTVPQELVAAAAASSAACSSLSVKCASNSTEATVVSMPPSSLAFTGAVLASAAT